MRVRRRETALAQDAPNPQARNLAQRCGSAPERAWVVASWRRTQQRLAPRSRRKAARRSWEHLVQLVHPSATLAARAQPTKEYRVQHACTPNYALPTCNARPAPLGALLEGRGALCCAAFRRSLPQYKPWGRI